MDTYFWQSSSTLIVISWLLHADLSRGPPLLHSMQRCRCAYSNSDASELAMHKQVTKFCLSLASCTNYNPIRRLKKFPSHSSPTTFHEQRASTFHFLGPGGTPHECLSVRTNEVHNLPNLGLKSHVQHAISLVKNLREGQCVYMPWLLVWQLYWKGDATSMCMQVSSKWHDHSITLSLQKMEGTN